MSRMTVMAVVLMLTAGSYSSRADDRTHAQTCRAYRELATMQYRDHDLAAATAILREAIGHCPDEPFYQFMLGNALYRGGQLREAVAAYSAFLKERENHVEGHMSLGFTIFELGDRKRAIEQWTAAVELEPASAFARAALAAGLFSLGAVDDALLQYELARTLDSHYADPQALGIDIRWKPPMRDLLTKLKELSRSQGDN